MNTNTKLAEALRDLDNYVCDTLTTEYPTGVDVEHATFKAARKALAAHDAEQAQEPAALGIKRYEPEPYIVESQGRLRVDGAVMVEKPGGRWVRFTECAAPVEQAAKAVPAGWKLVAVNAAFDDLMYWLDRCYEKGHLENCSDLVEPWAAFNYMTLSDLMTPPAPEAQPDDSELKHFLSLAEAAGVKSIHDLPGLIPALQATEAQAAPEAQQAAGQELPPLPRISHPEPHTMQFTDIERRYIQQFAEDYARATLVQRREPLTPADRERLRQLVMAEMTHRMPKISHEWHGWPGTWAFADVAVSALQDYLSALGIGATTGEQR